MVRKYYRRTTKGADQENSYSREVLELALADVRNGNRTQREAATFHGIPRSTLRHYIHGSRGSGSISRDGFGGGGKLSIPHVYEVQLADCLRVLEKWGFGLSRDEVMDMVQSFVQQNNIKTRFKEGRPGPDWFIAYKKRHNLSIKKPQGVEYVRMSQENPFVINELFDLLQKTIEENVLINKPHLIFNCDETGFGHDPSKTKVVGGKGVKCTRTISSAGRENTTVFACCSAAGDKLPLLCVLKGKNVMESWIDTNSDARTGYAASKSGWMDGEIFLNWFKKVFLPNIPEERPVLLILDGHKSHVSLPMILKAVEHQVVLVKLPPHTTHVTQPMDVGVFKGLKSNWDKKLTKWQRQNPRKKIPKQEFVNILISTFYDVNKQNITNAFKASGIYDEETGGPNRQEAIKKCKFKPCEVQAYNKAQLKKVADANEIHDDQTDADKIPDAHTDTEHTPYDSADVGKTPDAQADADKITDTDNSTHDHPDAEKTPDGQAGANNTPNAHRVSDRSSDVEMPNNVNVKRSFEDIIVEIFHKNKTREESGKESVKPKRKKVSSGAEIMTASEYIEKRQEEKRLEDLSLQQKNTKIEEKLLKQKNSIVKKKLKDKLESKNKKGSSKLKMQCEEKNQKKKRKIVSKPLTSVDLENPLPSTSGLCKFKKARPSSVNSDSDDDGSSGMSIADCESDKVVPGISVIKDDYVIVLYNGIKYPGQVVDLDRDQVQIKHMKSAGLTYWLWPEEEDILWYEEEDILRLIRPPIPMNKRGIFSVPELKGCLFEYE
ncbi:uncharacterized protein LOC134533739 [Bacillus rossius redtenbacheri]|uniref:uncharacterized protein LOC134533739 n=1 Tax=Bacillus rossius redtenbacheri TaxID=93214 RepID=UPI002FDD0DED